MASLDEHENKQVSASTSGLVDLTGKEFWQFCFTKKICKLITSF